jgi:hypothetical protein
MEYRTGSFASSSAKTDTVGAKKSQGATSRFRRKAPRATGRGSSLKKKVGSHGSSRVAAKVLGRSASMGMSMKLGHGS